MKDKINHHREALARILQMVTGEEPGQVALDILIKAGARAYFVEVPACEPRSGIEVLDCDRQSWVEEKY